MRFKLLNERDGLRTFALVFETGDEAFSGLTEFANQNHLCGSQFTAIGAFEKATLAYFDWERKAYLDIPIDEQVEVLALTGDVSEKADGKRQVHAHAVVGRRDGSTRGGHLRSGRVRPTLEVILTESPVHLRRRHDEQSGLSLIDPGKS
jgi:predicted DNA-binding protein with PD1-like motif